MTIWGLIVAAMFLVMVSAVFGHGDNCRVDGHTLRHITDSTVKAQFGLADAAHVHGFFDANGSGYAVSASGPLRSDCMATNGIAADRTTADYTPRRQPETGYGCDRLILEPDEICHEWDFNETHRVGVPALPDGVTTIADLWSYIYDRTGKRITIQSLDGNLWRSYTGQAGNEWGAVEIRPHMGLIIFYLPPFAFGIKGIAVEGTELELRLPEGKAVGVHVVGFPEVPSNYARFSDLVVDGVDWVERRLRINGKIQSLYIRNAGDAGDREIEPGDSVTIRIRKAVSYDLRGAVMGAPQAYREHTLTTSWGNIKRK